MGRFKSAIELTPNRAGIRFPGIWFSLLALLLVRDAGSQSDGKIQLVGVGTTSALIVYSQWFRAFEEAHPDTHLSYIPSGSATGIEMIKTGTANFGATDAPLSEKELGKFGLFQLAVMLGAIVPTYNVVEAQRPIRFSPQVLAGIYLGRITKWNDPAISDLNRDISLPSKNIVVIHTADGRGATYIWSDYLSKVSTEWRLRVGHGLSIRWPVGREADGNGNVVRAVKDTPNSIAYVELVYAVQNKLPCAQVQNAAGNFVSADSAGIEAAAINTARGRSLDSQTSFTNPPGARSYPLSSFIWILISENGNFARRAAMKDFLRWALAEGQSYAESGGFTRLPEAIVEQELKAIDQIP